MYQCVCVCIYIYISTQEQWLPPNSKGHSPLNVKPTWNLLLRFEFFGPGGLGLAPPNRESSEDYNAMWSNDEEDQLTYFYSPPNADESGEVRDLRSVVAICIGSLTSIQKVMELGLALFIIRDTFIHEGKCLYVSIHICIYIYAYMRCVCVCMCACLQYVCMHACMYSCHAMSCHAMSGHAMCCHVMSCHVMSCT